MPDTPRRPSLHSPKPGTARPSQGVKQELVEAYRQVINAEVEKRQKVKAERNAPPKPQYGRLAMAILMPVTAVWMWVAPQPWLDEKPQQPSRGVMEASLRLTMYLEAQRLEQFKTDSGYYPDKLSRIGYVPEGLTYKLVGPTRYLLRGVNGPVSVGLESGTVLATFLGGSLDTLNFRGRT